MSGSLAGVLQAVVDVGPVDDVEEGLHVVGAQVLVLEVVSMFPYVQSQQWNQSYNIKTLGYTVFKFYYATVDCGKLMQTGNYDQVESDRNVFLI